MAGGVHGWGACVTGDGMYDWGMYGWGDVWLGGMHGSRGMCGWGVHGWGCVWLGKCMAGCVCVAGVCMAGGHV